MCYLNVLRLKATTTTVKRLWLISAKQKLAGRILGSKGCWAGCALYNSDQGESFMSSR